MGLFTNDPQAYQRLKEGINSLGLVFDEKQIILCLKYLDLLHKWNSMFNLTSVAEDKWIVRHLLDSLSVYNFLVSEPREPINCLDIGSGGGLPGIPLAIACANDKRYTWHLLEKNSKKSGFLLRTKLELYLDNLVVINTSLESLGDYSVRQVAEANSNLGEEVDVVNNLNTKKTRTPQSPNSYGAIIPPRFNLAISRSSLTLGLDEKSFDVVDPVLANNAILIAMHGKHKGEPVQNEKFKLKRFDKIKVPSLYAERHIIIWRKLN